MFRGITLEGEAHAHPEHGGSVHLAGLMPMRQQLLARQGHSIWRVTHTQFNGVLLEVLQELLNYPKDPCCGPNLGWDFN